MTYQATGIDLTNKSLEFLKSTVSQNGTVRADQLFLKHLVRAQTSRQLMPVH